MRTASQRLLGPGVLLLITVVFYWKLTLTDRYTWLNNADATNQILPWMQFQAGEWHHGRFPLWDPNGWCGQSLIGQGQPGAAYPLNWLLFLAPLNHGWIRQAALNWYFVLTRYFAALACYALARELGRSRAASILAGCIYGLGGYVAHTISPQMVNGAVWTPLVFLFLFRAGSVKERRDRPLSSAVLSGFFLGFGWLAGHHQMNLFVTIAAAGLWMWLALREGKLNWPIARLAAISLIVAALASAFQTLPMAEYGRRSVRWVGLAAGPVHFNETVPYPIHEQYSLRPVSTLGIFLPGVEYNYGFYIGSVAFALGILGAIAAWRERQVRWLAAIGLGGIFFALGGNSVFHGVLYSLVPLVEKARVPGAAAVLFGLSAATLAAFGADLIAGAERQEWSRRFGWTLAIASAALGTAALVIFAAKIQAATGQRLMVPAIAGVLAAAVFARRRNGGISRQAGLVCLIGLVLFELANVSTSAFANRLEPNRYLHPLSEHGDLISFVRDRGEAARVEYDDQAIPYNIGDLYGIETFNAYLVSMTTNILSMDLFSPAAKDFFAIRYSLGKAAPRDGWVKVFTGSSGLKVFENPGAFPRAWSVHTAAPAAGVNPRSAVWGLRGTDPGFGGCSGENDDVQMPVHQPNHIRITADLECRGMVILTDTWFPGWQARVDGRAGRIYQVYGGVRGVMVDGGRHTIEMRYRPWSVFVGAALTLFAVILATWAANPPQL